MRQLSKDQWVARGTELYGQDPKQWKFRCVVCGHVQSGDSVLRNTPGLERVSTWIYFSCEGRTNGGVGCDWSLGGLLRLHRLEVDGQPVFEFANDPTDGWEPHKKPRECDA